MRSNSHSLLDKFLDRYKIKSKKLQSEDKRLYNSIHRNQNYIESKKWELLFSKIIS